MHKFKKLTLLFIFGITSFSLLGQTIYFQGFEPGDSWTILNGFSKISNDNGATYTPANQTIRSGNYFWKVNNSTDTLLLDSKVVTGYSNMRIVVRLASISISNSNGSEATDSVQIYAIIDGVTPPQADATIIGATNSRWGYDATLVGTTMAGSPATFASPQGGTSTNNYATIQIMVPNGTATVGLMIRGKNNSSNEIWAIDDIELIACPTITITGPGGGCAGDTLTFTSSHAGIWTINNSNATFASSPSNTNMVQVVLLNSGATSVTVDTGGCSATKTVAIYVSPTPPVVGPVTPICQGKTAILTANSPGNIIRWYDNINGAPIGTGNTFITPPITQSGIITFYAASQNNPGCFSSKVPVQVTVNPTPIKFDILGETVCSLDDAIISLDSSEAGVDYELYINGSATGNVIAGTGSAIDFIISNPVNGMQVFIEAMGSAGCITHTDTITLNIVTPPSSSYMINPDTLLICEGEIGSFVTSGSQVGIKYYVMVNGVPTSTFRVGTGQPLSFSVSNLETGDIISLLAVDTITGCEVELLDDIDVLVNPKPEVVITENSGIFTADSTTGTFVWYYNGNVITGQNQPSLDISQAGTSSGTYYLVYTNAFGCKDTSNTITLIVSELDQEIADLIEVYPNPFHEQIYVVVPTEFLLRLRNLLGQTVHEQSLDAGKNQVTISALPQGVYFLELIYKEQKWVKKIVKE